MKFSKVIVLALGGLVATAGLGLMVVSAAVNDKDYDKSLFMNPDNAVQHFEKIKFITGSSDSVVYMKKGGSDSVALVEIDANNFIMTQTGSSDRNIIGTGYGNSILGGRNNKINLTNDSNDPGFTKNNVILGGEDNIINKGYMNSVILGGKNNVVNGSQSVIVGGTANESRQSAVVVGNNNHANGQYSLVVGDNNTAGGINSVALGSHATVNGANSFLWSDGSSATVGNGNIFAVNAASGMVVGGNKAHSFSKLTIGGSLVVLEKDLGTCNSSYQGVLKVKSANSGKYCFCSCDGQKWNSLHGGGKCTGVCDADRLNPDCNNEGAVITCEAGNVYNITNGCKKGQIVKGTGAFLIDKFDKINWTCEEENGNTVVCESANVPFCNVPVLGF